jgi:hypothetical protein
MPVPYTFGTATAAIPLSQLDSNFATAITLGNTAVYLGNTTTSIGNLTLTNVTISSGNVTLTNVSVTTANVSGTANITTLVTTNDATIQGVTVGRGAGAVATNTAVGASALAANSGGNNTSVGAYSLLANTTGAQNSAFGTGALEKNTTGANGTAVGVQALNNNTTASENTAVGYQALYTNTTGAVNVAVGKNALQNSNSSNNTAVGGGGALYSLTSGANNTAVGFGAGYNITTGAKNTIIGSYNGNQGGLDIRTASNNIVLSDGDGNPRFNYITANGSWSIPYLGKTNTGRGQGTILALSSGSNTYDGSIQITDAVANNVWWGLLNGAAYVMTNGGGVQLAADATAWSSVSDSRLKNVTGTYTNALTDIAQIEAVKFTWKSDKQANPQVGVIAQSVQGVVPEAISTTIENGEEYFSVRYTELIPLMIASIKELKAEVDSLKAQLNGASA